MAAATIFVALMVHFRADIQMVENDFLSLLGSNLSFIKLVYRIMGGPYKQEESFSLLLITLELVHCLGFICLN